MRIIYVHADREEEVNSSVWRCQKPAHALREAGHEAEVVYWTDFDVEQGKNADIVVFQRYCWHEAIEQVQVMKKCGVVTVYDFDDDYHAINETNQGYPFWYEGVGYVKGHKIPIMPPKPIKSFDWIRKEVDIVTTPSVYLNQKYGARLMENLPTLRFWKKKIKRKHKTKVIGWGGGSSHIESWRDSNIIEPLLDAAKDMKWNIRIVGAPQIMNEILAKTKGMKRKPMIQFKPFMPASHWPQDMSSQFNLFVIPLAHEYDKARSPIKAIECGLAGLPWIATDNGVYQDFLKFGSVVKNTEQAWYDAIIYAMKNTVAQTQAALSARNYMLDNYLVENNVDHILEVYTP